MEMSASPDSKLEDAVLQNLKKEMDIFKVGVCTTILSGLCSLNHYDENASDFEVFGAWQTLVEAEGSGITEIHDAKQAVKTNGPFWERRFTKFKI